MKIKTRYIKFPGILLMSVITFVTGLAFFLPYLLDVNAYREEILGSLQKSLKRQVSFKTGTFAWQFGPSFVFNDFVVKEPDGKKDLLSSEQISVHLALMPLMNNRIVFKSIDLNGASLTLIRNADGTLNIEDLLKPDKDAVQVQFKRLVMKKSTIKWHDFTLQKDGFTAQLINTQLTLDHLARGRKGHIKLSADLPALKGPATSILISGSLRLPGSNSSLLETEINCDADIKQAEIGRFWPYFGRFIPFSDPGGRLSFLSNIKGKLQQFTAKGKIQINNITLNWPSIFHAVLSPRLLQVNYSMKLTKQLIDISAVDVTIDEIFTIKGNVQIHDYTSKDPRIIAKASTPQTFKYEEIRNYVPYGIIEKDAADYVENKIKSGIFKLDTGTLDGRVSQITHMEIGQNYNTLVIRGPVENAVLSYGPKAPTFNNIKGIIELKGKNFNLIGMSGLFGTSPFKLDGSITEYNTDKRSDYPVRMDILPRGPEIAWLAGIVGASKLDYSSSSSLKLTGSGHHSAYRLSGEWDLKQASYSFPGAVRKPAGLSNNLTFSSIIGKDETRLSSISYNLAPLILSGNALFRYGNQPYLGFDLQTNPFILGESLPILSMWQKYKPRGKIQAHIKGNGNPEDFSSMGYDGTILLNAFSLQPDEKLKAVSGINGTFTFRGNSMETSSISARYGDSLINFKGKIKRLQDPEAEIYFTSPELFLRDINMAQKRPETSIRRFNASLSIRNGMYTFKSVSGLLNSSNFNISGVYLSGRSPEATLTIASTKLNIDDLVSIAPIEATSQSSTNTGANYKIKLQVDAGHYKKFVFNKLNASAQMENGNIYVQDFNAGVFGGKVSAKGRIAQNGTQGNRYDLSIDLNKVNCEKLLTALDVSREISGSLTLHGNLTASGNNLSDIKKSALGNIRLQMKDGTLRKFNTLSKVFSILNISQLLKFQLPDMVSGGMPYNNIKGSIAVKDGTISSQDMFISSDAINISIIGSANIVKEELDFMIGVQPLQTVDKVVNRIPIVGWLLTGKDKDFLTAYFEAKGKWSDPKVSAIPVKSIGTGVLNIFRRVFELPVRLFTDTGEVILGQ